VSNDDVLFGYRLRLASGGCFAGMASRPTCAGWR